MTKKRVLAELILGGSVGATCAFSYWLVCMILFGKDFFKKEKKDKLLDEEADY